MDHPRTPPRGISIRPITTADRDGLTTFYAGLSDDSRQTRFHGVSHGISARAATTFCGPDHEHREGFVAVASDRPADPPTIVGHLCLEPAGAGGVEMAVAVSDPRQGAGIGRALLDAAIAWARHHAVGSLQASMLTTNSAIVGLLRSPGLPLRFSKTAAGVVTATLELAPAVPTAA